MRGDVRLTMARDGLLVGVPVHAERPVPALVVADAAYLGVLDQRDNPVTVENLQPSAEGGCRRVHLAPGVRLDVGLSHDGAAGWARLGAYLHTGAEAASLHIQRSEYTTLLMRVYPHEHALMLDGRLCVPDARRPLEYPAITDEAFVPAELPTLLGTYVLLGVNVPTSITTWAGVFAHVVGHVLAGRPLSEDGGG